MGGDIAGSLGGDIGGGKKQQAPHFVVRVKEHSSHQITSKYAFCMMQSGSLHGRQEGCFGFPRSEGNLEVEGDVNCTSCNKMYQPNTSRLETVCSHSLIINPSLGMYQEIHPYWASRLLKVLTVLKSTIPW